ncbi:magnesium transport protein CorA [Sporosarcina sp. NCCP-2716]|uniref:magnesium transporter CorA family protein n=1 Tax=Sporosarcina sp. NCCP-2716 TaxID=2943679 RepID=UPI00203F2C3A|nr:magnesium transporter CorA family protein [Sporosarcina sp. NCCP-2716]GKV68522.1 magnesium transport protein CorA [Sporosarcina sp. NCCP-2716]
MYFSFKHKKWEWKEEGADADLGQLLSSQPDTGSSWLESLKASRQDIIGSSTAVAGEEAIWGRLTYEQSMQVKTDRRTVAFFLTENMLITSELDRHLFPSEAREELEKKLELADNAVQAFVVFLNTVLHKFLSQIDHFEHELRELIWGIKENNSDDLLERIADSKHALIVWRNLVIPLVETQMTLDETFSEPLMDEAETKRLCTRLERLRMLISEYGREIEALSDMENLVSTQRGNEIMKTLTVITTIFTPAAVFGAIWGMNFKSIPEFEWAHGYAFALTVILSTTFALYFYLKQKGWIGDILKTRSKKKIIR